MAAGATYDCIATTTLGSNQTSVTFSSISGAYTDVILVIGGKFTSNDTIFIELNGDTTNNNYSATSFYGDGTNPGSARYNSSNSIYQRFAGYFSGGVISTAIMHFNNYSNTTTYKTVLTRTSPADYNVAAVVNLWRSTAAINSIKVSGGTFASGTVFSLYGIAAA